LRFFPISPQLHKSDEVIRRCADELIRLEPIRPKPPQKDSYSKDSKDKK